MVHGIDEKALVRAVAVRGGITGAAAAAAWAMASLTGRPARAATVALITLVGTELAQTLVDSHAPLVWLTATGSFAVFAAAISLPGIIQLLGCTPIGPLGWAQALGAAGAAVGAIALAPRVLPQRWQKAVAPLVSPEEAGETGQVVEPVLSIDRVSVAPSPPQQAEEEPRGELALAGASPN